MLLAFLQVLVLNNINLGEYGITPFVYILLIIVLPFETSNVSLLLFAFFLGLFIDVFEDTGGVHASATVFIAFIRPFILNIFKGRDGYPIESTPGISDYGFVWFIKYAFVLIFVHSFIYYIVLQFSFENFFLILLKMLFTGILTIFLIIISQYLVFKR